MILSLRVHRKSITTCNVWKAGSVKCRSKAVEALKIYTPRQVMQVSTKMKKMMICLLRHHQNMRHIMDEITPYPLICPR
jgi:hypothetical protein